MYVVWLLKANTLLFKWTVLQDGYIYEGINTHLNQFLCMVGIGFQGLSKASHSLYNLLKFYLLLWNYLLISKMFTETLLRIPFYVTVGRCSLVSTSHSLLGKCARMRKKCGFQYDFTESKRLSVSIFSVKITALGPLKWVTGRIFKIS